MAKRRRTGNRTFPKRSMLWCPFDVTVSLVSSASPVSNGDLLSNYFSQTGEEVPIGSTIGPVRGRWLIEPAVSTTFAFDQAVTALLQLNKEGGRTQTASPSADILDAMWYGQMAANGAIVESAAGVFNQLAREGAFDTKAMRKITGNGQQLVPTAVQNGNADYDVRFFGNVMIRLP